MDKNTTEKYGQKDRNWGRTKKTEAPSAGSGPALSTGALSERPDLSQTPQDRAEEGQ